MDSQSARLKLDIVERLRELIDPETGVDVIRMRLIEDLEVDAETGRVAYIFRPSSALCPLAVHLALSIRDAVAEVPGVGEQNVQVAGYVGADELNKLLADSR